MVKSSWKTTPGRLRALLTGRVEWVDPEDGVTEVEWLGWRDRWSIFGVHSYTWDWVRKYGALDCGCTRNPVTRQTVLTAFLCPEHGHPSLRAEEPQDDEPVMLDDIPAWFRRRNGYDE